MSSSTAVSSRVSNMEDLLTTGPDSVAKVKWHGIQRRMHLGDNDKVGIRIQTPLKSWLKKAAHWVSRGHIGSDYKVVKVGNKSKYVNLNSLENRKKEVNSSIEALRASGLGTSAEEVKEFKEFKTAFESYHKKSNSSFAKLKDLTEKLDKKRPNAFYRDVLSLIETLGKGELSGQKIQVEGQIEDMIAFRESIFTDIANHTGDLTVESYLSLLESMEKGKDVALYPMIQAVSSAPKARPLQVNTDLSSKENGLLASKVESSIKKTKAFNPAPLENETVVVVSSTRPSKAKIDEAARQKRLDDRADRNAARNSGRMPGEPIVNLK